MSRLKSKNHMIFSIDAEKAFDKIQHPFMIKMISKLGLEGNFLNVTKEIYKKPTNNFIINGERFNAFSLRLGIRQECLLSPLLLHTD